MELPNGLTANSVIVIITVATFVILSDGLPSQHAEESGPKALKFKLVHRHAEGSPAPKEFGSTEEEIMELIQLDEMRMQGLYAPFVKRKSDETSSSKCGNHSHMPASPSPPPPSYKSSPPQLPKYSSPLPPPYKSWPRLPKPSPPPIAPAYQQFHGRLTSGASLPRSIGQYFVELYIGTPPQRFLSIVDTGSDLIWVPCSFASFASSQLIGAALLPNLSSTYSAIPCTANQCDLVPPPPGATCSTRSPTMCKYTYGYSDTSVTSGILASDELTMQSRSGALIPVERITFGCGINNTGPSITKVGGVLGLGQGPISFSSQVGDFYGNKFSYCFTSFFNRSASSALIFGEQQIGVKLLTSFQYIGFFSNPSLETYYYIAVEGVRLAGRTLPIPPSVWALQTGGLGGVLIDSGTTLTFFIQPAYDIIVSAFKAATSLPVAPPTAGLNVCYNVSTIREPRLPKFSIIMSGGTILRPPLNNYFLTPMPGLRCLGFMPSPVMTVLGNLLQQNYYVEYDRSRKMIGFARAHCAT